MIKSILVGIDTLNEIYDISYTMKELQTLASTEDYSCEKMIIQKMQKPNNNTYVGKGKLEEILVEAKINDAKAIIFNDELSPRQFSIIEEFFSGYEILDRALLILKIFEKRATSEESILEIKLAKYRYMLPRINTLHDNFDRQGGKGLGETKLELDKRHLQNEIYQIKERLLEIEKMKKAQITKRAKNNIKTVSLVGYTNAGKSSTMNTILDYANKKESLKVVSKDKLFQTLETRARKISLNNINFILTDTIGFISKLPHDLVYSFRQTLEEIKNADLIIHVLDVSTPYFKMQYETTMNTLNSLNVLDKPMLILLNKADLVKDYVFYEDENHLMFSNETKLNLDKLISYITKSVTSDYLKMSLKVPFEDGKALSYILKNTKVLSKIYLDTFSLIEALVPKECVHYLLSYEADEFVS